MLTLAQKHKALLRLKEKLTFAGWEVADGWTMNAGEGWHGVATKGETIFVVDCDRLKAGRKSGKKEERWQIAKGAACTTCAGTGAQPGSPWTWQNAWLDPVAFYASRGIAADAWRHPDASLFLGNGSGAEKCHRCGGRGYDLDSRTTIAHTWPKFLPNPSSADWHIQWGETITHNGIIPAECGADNRNEWWPAIDRLYHILNAAAGAARIKANERDMAKREASPQPESRHYTARAKGSWIWLTPSQPLNAEQAAVINRKGGTRKVGTNQYYFKSRDAITAEELDQVFA